MKSKTENRMHPVFAFNDLLAIGALALCQREGIRVPDELSVISMDDTKDSIFTIRH